MRRRQRFHRWRVLVVEDDDLFAQAVRTLLEADGRLEVVGTARDGHEGVELAETLRPDVVLMDIVLPGMDGVEATREIRRRQPTIPVVGITAANVSVSYATPPSTSLSCSPTLHVGCIAAITVTYHYSVSTPFVSMLIGPINMTQTSEMPIERVFP